MYTVSPALNVTLVPEPSWSILIFELSIAVILPIIIGSSAESHIAKVAPTLRFVGVPVYAIDDVVPFAVALSIVIPVASLVPLTVECALLSIWKG